MGEVPGYDAPPPHIEVTLRPTQVSKTDTLHKQANKLGPFMRSWDGILLV